MYGRIKKVFNQGYLGTGKNKRKGKNERKGMGINQAPSLPCSPVQA